MEKNKVVIVDDEIWILKGIEKTFDFEEYGFEVLLATTKPNEAVDFILQNDVDVVFVDVKMPIMTGIELINRVKDGGKNPCFVIISGYDNYDYMREAIKNKVFDYCLKPIVRSDAEEVLKRLRSHFDEIKVPEISESTTTTIDNKNFLKLIDYINEHYKDKLMLKELANQFFFNPNYLCMLFNKYFGKTYSQYLLCIRLEKARELLKDKNMSTYDVAESVGFNNYSYFNKKYFQYWGETPANTRKGFLKDTTQIN